MPSIPSSLVLHDLRHLPEGRLVPGTHLPLIPPTAACDLEPLTEYRMSRVATRMG